MTDKLNIYEALAAVMAEVDHVGKNQRNEFHQFNFRGIDAVVNAVGPALRTHKVIVVPEVERYDYGTFAAKDQKVMGHARVVVAYTFYGPDGSSIRSSAAGEAFDSGDKATPKAMSVAFRTALLQALALPTDDPDPDTQVYERGPVQQPMPDERELAKNRAWALTKKHAETQDQRVAFLDAALQARGSSLVAATAADFTALADEWEAAS